MYRVLETTVAYATLICTFFYYYYYYYYYYYFFSLLPVQLELCLFQKKIKSVKKSTDDDDEGQDDGVSGSGSAAEAVIADEAFKLLLLVLMRASATLRRIQSQSLWGSTGNAVIGRVRDSLTKVRFAVLCVPSVL